MKETVIITGGAGFIGSHFCEHLNKDGFSVICIDNLITGRERNISGLVRNRYFKFIKQDVTKKLKIKISDVYAVLHFASPASPKDYIEFPIETLKAGSFGTYNALELARRHKARFLLASTSEVYGDPIIHPQNESYWGNVNPIGIRSVYDEAKRYAEALTMAYHRVFHVDTKIVRIFNTYGPRMRLNDGRALPNFFNQALKGKNITIYGDGSQTRSFCYVEDLIRGLFSLLRSKEHQPVNLGNPEEITVKQLAREIIKITGTKSKIIYKSLPQDDPKRRQPDITKAKKLLNWRPMVGRSEGLRRTLEYFIAGC